MGERGYAGVLLAAVVALCLGVAAVGAHVLGVAARRAAALDLDTAGARLAADTGLERISRYLCADPNWSDGSVAEGPVGPRSRVERVVVEREGDVVEVTSYGVSGVAYPVRKVARMRARFGPLPLVEGGGVKVLSGLPLSLSGSSEALSDLLVTGGLVLTGNARVGSRSEPRDVYVDGDVFCGREGAVEGSVYATGQVTPGAATGEVVSGWQPPGEFPDISQVAQLVELGSLQAHLLEEAGAGQRWFPGDRVFTAADLAGMEGVYYVGGTVYLPGGWVPGRVTLVAARGVVVSGWLEAPGLALVSGGDLVLRNSAGMRVALAVAGGDAGWGGTGGGSGSLRLQYGALVCRTLNGQDVRGNVVLEQDDEVDLALLSGPVRTVQVLERVGD